jgi:hypothetical protein
VQDRFFLISRRGPLTVKVIIILDITTITTTIIASMAAFPLP